MIDRRDPLKSSVPRRDRSRYLDAAEPGSVEPASQPITCGFSASAVSSEDSRKPDPQTPVTGGFILARLFEAAG